MALGERDGTIVETPATWQVSTRDSLLVLKRQAGGGFGMLTFEEAMSANYFHENHETGGKVYTWHRNGQTKTWKTRPGEFRIPVKYGLYRYGYIFHTTAHLYHTEEDCPDDR